MSVGLVGEFITTIAGLTTAATTYTAADQMGTVAVSPALSDMNGAEVNIVGIVVTDDSGVLGAFDLVVFGGTAAPTLAADNAAAAISAADNQNVKAVFSFLAANCVNTGGRITATFIPPSGVQPVKLGAGVKTVWFGLIARTANAVFASGATSVKVILLVDRS